ncbi:MAG TPA: HAD hydrolase-like protein, partial [Lachnospiraceae bacterium]|nr:HAD hydrolase-like protein [Lachnospiraceae bacterium]
IKCLAGQKEDVIYIGDSEVDLATARNAGVDCISVEWGFRDHDFLVSHGATTLVDSTDTLLQLLI